MNRQQNRVRIQRLALSGLLIAAAFVLSWIEYLLPLPVGIPGVKLGLCHVAVLFALYRLGWKQALAVTAVRVALAFLLFGNAATLAYSAVGAAVSLAVMLCVKRIATFSPLGVSVAGALGHTIGQLVCAAVLMKTTALMWYVPVLLAAGIGTGAAVGILSALTLRYVPIHIKNGEEP